MGFFSKIKEGLKKSRDGGNDTLPPGFVEDKKR